MPSSQWDSRFSAEHYVYGREPNAHLVGQAGRLPPGSRILVPGDGEGRNGVWLARQGMEVLSVDGSSVGLGKARALAQANAVSIATEHADLLTWTWPKASFDAVVSIFLHFPPTERRQVHAHMAAALRPGGILILEAFRPEQLNFGSGGPKDPTMLYEVEDLRSDFAALDIEMIEDVEISLEEGPLHRGPGAVVRMVAIKPTRSRG